MKNYLLPFLENGDDLVTIFDTLKNQTVTAWRSSRSSPFLKFN